MTRVGVPKYGNPLPAAAAAAEVAVTLPEPTSEVPAPAEAKALKQEVNDERKELLMDSITQLVGLYSIVMACLLSLFVEQVCPPNAKNPVAHQCTLSDDFASPYERAVLAINFTCLAIFVGAQSIFWLREKFMCAPNCASACYAPPCPCTFSHRRRMSRRRSIEHFKEDTDQPGDNLPEEVRSLVLFSTCAADHLPASAVRADRALSGVPVPSSLAEQASIHCVRGARALRAHAERQAHAVLTCVIALPSQFVFVALLCNFGLSAYLILQKHYAGRTSVIGLLSNTFLCMGKVLGYRTCVQCRCGAGACVCAQCFTADH